MENDKEDTKTKRRSSRLSGGGGKRKREDSGSGPADRAKMTKTDFTFDEMKNG